MANINLAALNMFRAANNWTADSIANLDGGKAIKKVDDYSGPFSALGRSDVEKAANNEARTALLKALDRLRAGVEWKIGSNLKP